MQDMCAVGGHNSDQYVVSKSVKPVSAAADCLPLIRPLGAARSFGRETTRSNIATLLLPTVASVVLAMARTGLFEGAHAARLDWPGPVLSMRRTRSSRRA